MTEQRISEATRRNIFDRITLANLPWWGRLDDLAFLSRLYNLKEMRSTDHRYSNAAGDIHQHRVRNLDWDNDWVFTDPRFDLLQCPDADFLRFLCETIHPVAQPDGHTVTSLLEIFNAELANDGFQIAEATQMSNRPVFAAREIVTPQPALDAAKQISAILTTDYLTQQITRMETAIRTDPALAIGTAKELIETVCKTILRERGAVVDENLDVPKLVRKTLEMLQLVPDGSPKAAEASASIRRTLGNLAQVATGAAELRNLYGTGHGKHASHPVPPPHHARLAVGAASTLAVFLYETHQMDPPAE